MSGPDRGAPVVDDPIGTRPGRSPGPDRARPRGPVRRPDRDTGRDPAAARFYRAGAGGAAAALAVLGWFALRGTLGLLDRLPLADFYETQARTLLHGHWDAGPDAYTFERFRVGGRFYTYFGPLPALLRMPVVLVLGDRADGRLSRLAVLAGCALVLVALVRLAWQARTAFRGGGRPTRLECLAVAGLTFVAACGSPVVFLAGWTAVYHEAIVWGVGFALLSSSYLVAHVTDGRRRDLVLAGVTAACSVLSRGSVGFGPIAAIGVVLAAQLVGWWRDRPRRLRAGTRPLGLLAAAVVVPVLLYGAVNQAKFGEPFGLPPYEKQDLLADWPTRGPALEANGGSLFGPGYAPTILLQYLRPDGIGFDRLFPWVTFSRPPTVVGDAVFEARNNSISLPAGSPALVGLGLLGAVAAVDRRARAFRAPLLGGLVGSVGAFSLAFVDQRYQGDLLPLLLPAAVLGSWWLVARLARPLPRPSRRRPWPVALVGLLVVAGLWSCWANGAVALTYQRTYRADVTTAERAAYVGFQLAVHDALSDGPPSRVRRGARPEEPAAAGTIVVEGACDAVHWSDGSDWHPLETTAATGLLRLRVVLPPPVGSDGPGGPEPLVTTADADGRATVWIEWSAGGAAVVSYGWAPAEGRPGEAFVVRQSADPLVVEPGRPFDLTVHLDRRGFVGTNVSVTAGKRTLLFAYARLAISAPTLGTGGGDGAGPSGTFRGRVSLLPDRTPICDRLTRLGV
ncbi:MAG: ArnT family glycosyltransferase [Acidimicrobiia bacterium]